jgi:nucleotide-binding universal stress UspA family protein
LIGIKVAGVPLGYFWQVVSSGPCPAGGSGIKKRFECTDRYCCMQTIVCRVPEAQTDSHIHAENRVHRDREQQRREMMDDEERARALLRLQARLDALENLKGEIEPWQMEERDASAREALANVIAHADAEIVELHRRREAIGALPGPGLSERGAKYSRILVAVDESSGSQQAVDYGAGLARRLSATLRIVHVVDMGTLPLWPELAIDIDAISKARRAVGEKVLASARERARAAGIEAETKLLETATPTQRVSTVIADEAACWPADAVVLATHGRHGMERLLIGSVAEGVARFSTVPVLLVPWQATAR